MTVSVPVRLNQTLGTWAGTKAVIEPGEPRHDCACTATIAEAMVGQFLEVRYNWSFEGASQSGLLLVHAAGDIAKAVWLDSWHNADSWMTLTGSVSPSSVDLRGSYPAGDGPDWGWRIVLDAADPLTIDMYNITPAGEEMIGVEIRLQRA
jgi:Protein of unknown function (DUF1579)